VEHHDYGMQKGVRKLLCYQIDGRSSSGKVPDWRTFRFDAIEQAQVTDVRFPGARSVRGRHVGWDELFASVSRKPFARRP
jgi:hypothetical protein